MVKEPEAPNRPARNDRRNNNRRGGRNDRKPTGNRAARPAQVEAAPVAEEAKGGQE
jgi:hypothetical protein